MTSAERPLGEVFDEVAEDYDEVREGTPPRSSRVHSTEVVLALALASLRLVAVPGS
jgi:hypothetical protein